MIGITNDAHEKWWHGIYIRDLEVEFIIYEYTFKRISVIQQWTISMMFFHDISIGVDDDEQCV